jgi:predicted metal-dependent hydrolase
MSERDPTTPVEEIVTTDLFKAEVRWWAERIGVHVKEIHVRQMTRKLASASTSGRLTFDAEFLHQSQTKRTEVLVHELVHLKVGNHGPPFRSLLRAYISDSGRTLQHSQSSGGPPQTARIPPNVR